MISPITPSGLTASTPVSGSEVSTPRPLLHCSIGIMAFNEEGNIGKLLAALRKQDQQFFQIDEIIVLASGCTDNTEAITRAFAEQDPRIRLVSQPRREGKARAVNHFLELAQSEILILESADTLPGPKTIQLLLEPFKDPNVGMTGTRPVPVNDRKTFMGFAVHLLWDLHHQIALKHPKMGEMIAFRKVFQRIPLDSAVDEANIEPLVRGQGYELRYQPDAVVYNRGPDTVADFLKQRRRIHAGHLLIRQKQGYAVSTMGFGHILAALLGAWNWEWRYFAWVPAAAALEAYARFLGRYDVRVGKNDHAVWAVALSTKGAIE